MCVCQICLWISPCSAGENWMDTSVSWWMMARRPVQWDHIKSEKPFGFPINVQHKRHKLTCTDNQLAAPGLLVEFMWVCVCSVLIQSATRCVSKKQKMSIQLAKESGAPRAQLLVSNMTWGPDLQALASLPIAWKILCFCLHLLTSVQMTEARPVTQAWLQVPKEF